MIIERADGRRFLQDKTGLTGKCKKAPGRKAMEFYAEAKFLGDANPGGFTAGLSMAESATAAEFEVCSETEGLTVFRDKRAHEIHQKRTKVGEAVCIETTFVNHNTEPVTLEMLATVALRGVRADKVHRLQSNWSAEGKLRTETVLDLHMEVSWNRCATRVEKFGTVGSMPVRKYFPFVALEDSETGEFTAIQLYCPASWQIELLRHFEEDRLSVVAGLADRDFGHWMKNVAPGESFTTPRAMLATGHSLYEVCDKLVKAQRPDISPVDDHMGILFNEYCTTWGNPTFENVKKICDKLEGRGIQYLVIDSGWYGKMDGWWNCIGDWDVNEEKFPGGMKPIADYIRSKGMIPGLWFELESIAHMSAHYNDKEHLITKDGLPLTGSGRRFWDMEDPWVIDYLSERVIKLLKDCGFGYLKVDYNDTLGIGCDGAESLGEGLYRKVYASQEFFRKIKREIPDIVIENCSSGGHRLEPSMMELASQASFSDAHETVAIPLIAANMHRVIKPSQSQIWAVMRAEDSDSRIFYSIAGTFFGRMCLSGDIYKLSDHQWTLISQGMEFYRAVADIIEQGVTESVTYTTQSYNHPTGEQVLIRRLGNRSLVIAHRFENSKEIDTSFLDGACVLATYGAADRDFSAQAWLLER